MNFICLGGVALMKNMDRVSPIYIPKNTLVCRGYNNKSYRTVN